MALPKMRQRSYTLLQRSSPTTMHKTYKPTNRYGENTMNEEPLSINKSFDYTDEDYALVLNIWRKELGLDPIV